MKGEKYFENIHENYVPNVKDHVLYTFMTKYNEARVVANTSLRQNFILKKKRKLLKKHNSGLSTLPERSDNQIKINICTEEENVLEVLSGVYHWEKRTQIKERKLNFEEHLHLVKRERIEAEDETKKIVEGLNKGGIASANDNNGENMASDNACVLNQYHFRNNNILSSNSLETEGDLPHG